MSDPTITPKVAKSRAGEQSRDELHARYLSSLLIGMGPDPICSLAISEFRPKKIFTGFSGGFDSLVNTHWMMNNVPGCEVFHANTGIGIEATRVYVRETCKRYGWPLTEIRAKEDCGQDYDKLVIERGFPGPGHHGKMFQRLKESCVEVLVKRNKSHVRDCVMLATGIRQDESVRRSGYHYTVIEKRRTLMWVNPFYYRTREWFAAYIKEHNLQQNPVSLLLGMSGECLCGAYAHPGELDLIKVVCPATWKRIKDLEQKVFDAGHSWGWESAPPAKKSAKVCPNKPARFMPFCVGCDKEDNGVQQTIDGVA